MIRLLIIFGLKNSQWVIQKRFDLIRIKINRQCPYLSWVFLSKYRLWSLVKENLSFELALEFKKAFGAVVDPIIGREHFVVELGLMSVIVVANKRLEGAHHPEKHLSGIILILDQFLFVDGFLFHVALVAWVLVIGGPVLERHSKELFLYLFQIKCT